MEVVGGAQVFLGEAGVVDEVAEELGDLIKASGSCG
jgi:hypothetical protein